MAKNKKHYSKLWVLFVMGGGGGGGCLLPITIAALGIVTTVVLVS